MGFDKRPLFVWRVCIAMTAAVLFCSNTVFGCWGFSTIQEDAVIQQDSNAPPENVEQVGNGKIKFNFKDGKWEDVIRWLCLQGGFSLQEPEVFPPQSFVYSDDQEYTILEAIDLINRHLSLRGYTLVRNNKLMYLVEKDSLGDDNWRQIIEVIPEAELANRGQYEIVKVKFDLRDMNLEGLDVRELEGMVERDHRDEFVFSEQGKFMVVREIGHVLRDMKQVLDRVRDFGIDNSETTVIEIQHSTVEDVMPIVRGLIGLDDQNQPQDSEMRLTIFVDAFARKVYARGDARWLALLRKTIQTVDDDQKAAEVLTEELYLCQVSGIGQCRRSLQGHWQPRPTKIWQLRDHAGLPAREE